MSRASDTVLNWCKKFQITQTITKTVLKLELILDINEYSNESKLKTWKVTTYYEKFHDSAKWNIHLISLTKMNCFGMLIRKWILLFSASPPMVRLLIEVFQYCHEIWAHQFQSNAVPEIFAINHQYRNEELSPFWQESISGAWNVATTQGPMKIN